MSLVNPSSTLTEIVTTTLRNRTGKLADNVTINHALLNRLREKGKVMPVFGGRTIVQEIEYAANGTYKRYSGYEAVNIAPSDVFTGAEFSYAQSAVAVSISGLEMLMNSGEEAIIDLLESRIKNAEKTLINNVALDVYSDGTADGGRQIGGTQLIIPASSAGNTVGGINSATYPFWQPTYFSGVTNGGAPVSPANIQSYMNRVWVQQVRGTDKPDLICADNNFYRMYWESLQAIQRIQDTKMGRLGFTALKYDQADVVLDGGFNGGMSSNTMYFFNTDYLYFRPHRDRYFAPIGEDRFAVNQDAMVKLIGFAGNVTVSNRRLQAVLGA
jgi:hypothetical protein